MNQPYNQYNPPYASRTPKSTTLAVFLELVPGFFFQTFGIGTLYAGNVGLGIAFLIGYWVLLGVNIVLCFLFIGFITLPLCWLGMMILIRPAMDPRMIHAATTAPVRVMKNASSNWGCTPSATTRVA